MKTLFSFLTITALTLFIYSSCNEVNNEVQKDFSISEATQIVADFNKEKLPFQEASLIKGAVEIITTENEVVIFVTQDGNKNLFYVLQHDTSKPKIEISESIASAQIMFFRKNLLIVSLDNKKSFFFNSEKEVPSYLSELEMGETIYGYGLARYSMSEREYNYDAAEEFHGVRTINDFIGKLQE